MNLQHLSDVQRRAVTLVDGPVLVLAGAGSGKTSVLTNRVAYLINEKNVSPYHILAITFTNKAANEMKERIAALVDYDVSRMAIATFHSICARFLRHDAELIGYMNNFTIYDTDDSTALIKKVMQNYDHGLGQLTPKYVRHVISMVKNSSGYGEPEEVLKDISEDFSEPLTQIYRAYNEALHRENAMDFDDLLLNMLRVLQENQEAREYYTERFQYVLVDEYQDTNSVQYELVKLFSEKHKNLFVVGDDDQSIYAWRGADVRNILNFEKDFKNAQVIKLEQNYRSHQRILDAANAVIRMADARKEKNPWSAKTDGPKPKVYTAYSEYAEGEFIAKEISGLVRGGKKYEEIAVLYRTHTQSRVLEEKLRMYGIPYRVYGGMSFYARKEIKDIVAYLTLLENPMADTAFLRIINTPKRGIGNVTVNRLTEYAEANRLSLMEAAAGADSFMKGGTAKFSPLLEVLRGIETAAEGKSIGEMIEIVFERSGYHAMLLSDDDITAEAKIENVQELINSARVYEAQAEEPTLEEFLSTVSLITDMDTVEEEGGVTLMTLHSSKGLEFDTVFMAGMEENLFPSKRSVEEGKLDEERRLCYVGMTRAKNLLYLTGSATRTMYSGGSSSNAPSRFLRDIPPEAVENLSVRKDVKQIGHREETTKPRINFFQAKAEFVPKATADPGSFRVGGVVEHGKFGKGTILAIDGQGDQRVARIAFAGGEKKLFLSFAPLTVIE
ncbi:MAG: ATP-dependent DNA helicase PcrA [Clostridiales bacterium]|nr:MAG: ATP-dependent DNA helicase PcrA [Clostridiales bacterium]